MKKAEMQRRLDVLTQRAEDAAAEADADDEYWSEVATGQDTEEAEASGGLRGYANGLDYAVKLLRGEIDVLGAANFETYSRERLAEYKASLKGGVRTRSDEEALDELNLMLSAPEWPGASGMEDVAVVVRSTGRTEVPNAPIWERH